MIVDAERPRGHEVRGLARLAEVEPSNPELGVVAMCRVRVVGDVVSAGCTVVGTTEFGSWFRIVTRVPSSTTSTFGNTPLAVTRKVFGGKSGVPRALVPAAQIDAPAFEYIARSTTSCGGVAPCPSTRTEKRRPWAMVLASRRCSGSAPPPCIP